MLIGANWFGVVTTFLPNLMLPAVGGAGSHCAHGMLLFAMHTKFILVYRAAGKRPQRSLAAYGSYLRALPHANEQGLRMLIGAAVKEGAARGLSLKPLFSLYSYHGPVFRVMLRVERGSEGVDTSSYGWVGHCYLHGENRRVGWKGLSQAWCR